MFCKSFVALGEGYDGFLFFLGLFQGFMFFLKFF